MSPVEALGYAASAAVVIALSMRSMVYLRVLSLIGAVPYVSYGLLVGAWPVVVANAVIAGMNMWRLRPSVLRGSRVAGDRDPSRDPSSTLPQASSAS